MTGILQHVRDRLGRGFLLVLPMVITLWLLRLLFGVIHNNVTPVVLRVLESWAIVDPQHWHARLAAPIVGVILTLLFVYLMGLLAANLVGRRLWAMIERGILRVPVVKSIYGASRQLLDAISMTGAGSFSRVVLVQYPREGLWTLGFVTSEQRTPLVAGPAPEGGNTLFVFLPTTPNPTSGWLVLVGANDVRELDLSVEEGIKLIVSGGLVTPAGMGARLRPGRSA